MLYPLDQDPHATGAADLAIVLSGGGARAAYQVGLLRALARAAPRLRFSIVTGVSAGAINAVFLAAHPGSLADAADQLSRLWKDLPVEKVFRIDSGTMTSNALRWIGRLATGGTVLTPEVRGLVDTTPLRELLEAWLPTVDGELIGIIRNLERQRLQAVAVTTLDYSTGQTVTWVQGRDAQAWRHPDRVSVRTRLGIDHVMASAALPLFFPAQRIGRHWYGDGGVRLLAPLSPAIHLGARRILAISTRYRRLQAEAEVPSIRGYPPPAQILGQLMNAIFLDVLDQDEERLERLNSMIRRVPPEEREGLAPVDLLVLRPSQDLGKLAASYEPSLPAPFRFLTRGLGTRETRSPDFLSLLMFQPDYLARLIEIGEADAEARMDEILRLVTPGGTAEPSPTTEHPPAANRPDAETDHPPQDEQEQEQERARTGDEVGSELNA